MDNVVIEVVGAVVYSQGKILLAQRSCKDLYGKWEFPGGKVKQGETHQKALIREINEELSISITVNKLVAKNAFTVSDKNYLLCCYNAEIVGGKMIINEHKEVAWVEPYNLLNYELAPADVPIAEEIVQDARRN